MSRVLERAEKILKPFDDYGFSTGVTALVFGTIILFFLPDEIVAAGLGIAIDYAPLWVSIVLIILLCERWMEYVQTKEFFGLDRALIEIKLPDEITQSPVAMETALNTFFYTGEPDTVFDKYLKGESRSQFSLEIVSLEGDVRFFIYLRRKLIQVIEPQLYAQYPGIEIYEVPDYLPKIGYNPKEFDLFGLYQKLQKPDPYPIKTYVDYGLDKETKEEFKVDPLNAILEYLGAMGKGEYAFVQIMIRSHQAERKKPGSWFGREDWTAEAGREVQKIIDKIEAQKDSVVSFRSFTEGEKRTIESLERNSGKKPFDTGMRIMYLARKEHYRTERHSGMPTMTRVFESPDLSSNGLRPIFLGISYAWEDLFGNLRKARKAEIYEGYRRRSYFIPPNDKYRYFVMSAEEIATLYHFPGRVTQTPTLGRIGSRKEEAPPNLPL